MVARTGLEMIRGMTQLNVEFAALPDPAAGVLALGREPNFKFYFGRLQHLPLNR